MHAFDLHLEDEIDMLDFELPEQYTYDYPESRERSTSPRQANDQVSFGFHTSKTYTSIKHQSRVPLGSMGE